jgi:hypothetical protein
MSRRTRRNRRRIKRRFIGTPPAGPVRHIDPASINVTAPDEPFVIQPGWIEVPVDAAFWRVWKKPLRMRQGGYKLFKINGQWRAFCTKKSA